MMSQNIKTHTCQCGFSWQNGLSGSHMCEPYYRKKIAALNQQVVNLAVENANARSAITVFSDATEQLTEIIGDEIGMNGVAKILAGFDAVGNMPATNAAIANIQAQGVEKFAQHPALGIIACGHIALEFAAQLRKAAGNA